MTLNKKYGTLYITKRKWYNIIMGKEIDIKTIKFGEIIECECLTHNYGRAEFVVCPVFKDGILKNLFIYPKQQPKYFGKAFNVDLEGYEAKSIQYCGYPVLADPRIWYSFWCEEHKCYSVELYVADNTKYLKINPHFGDSISLEFT